MTAVYLIEPDSTINDLLFSLKQSMIDQVKEGNANSVGLSHIRSLCLEEYLAENFAPTDSLLNAYLEVVRDSIKNSQYNEQTKVKLAGLFITPEDASKYQIAFQNIINGLNNDKLTKFDFRLALLRSVEKGKKTLFEITDPTFGCSFSDTKIEATEPIFRETPSATLLETSDGDEGTTALLSRAISRFYSGDKSPVNLGVFAHVAITKALRQFIYMRPGKSPVEIPIGYSDGSQARPFPLLCLNKLSDRELHHIRSQAPLAIGQISDRHPEMDHMITRYLFRNQMVSVTRPLAVTDETAYQETKNILDKARKEGPLRITFYQVGFQPVTIGFYRAVVEELIESRSNPWLEIIPKFFDSGDSSFSSGSPWS